MPKELSIDDIFLKGSHYEINRNRIKDLYWTSKSENQVYSDENEDIYVFNSDNKLNIVGYLHGESRPFMVGNAINDFINVIKKLCDEKGWINYELGVITDFELRFTSEETIQQLPKDIKYYFLDTQLLAKSTPKNPAKQNLEYELFLCKRRWRQVSGPSILADDPNSESVIMNALQNGNGEIYGL